MNNDALGIQSMMKDQYANYVVQKIIDISNEKQRERLLECIQLHLVALKKYTYGKHIVARFEQLSGEEGISYMLSLSLSLWLVFCILFS